MADSNSGGGGGGRGSGEVKMNTIAVASKGVKYTDEVEREIELRREQEAEARELRKNTVAERMKKMAGSSGTAPGFSTAQLGAQIAAVAGASESRGASGKVSVKKVVQKVDDSS